MNIEKIYIGGWFQRTMLQLSEIYDFVREGKSIVDLDQEKTYELHKNLQIKTIEYGIDNLEYVKITTTNEINIKITEDGLIVLNTSCDDSLQSSIDILANYYETCLSPALNYIFSLGAPIPKELVNIENIYPYFVVLNNANENDIRNLIEDTEKVKYFEFSNDSYNIVRGDRYYFINYKNNSLQKVERYIEEQIFIKEFKEQLHRYLNVHRTIWKRIDDVKANPSIKGKDILKLSSQIDGYRKTVTLIDSRINQMDAYIRTREKIAKSDADLVESLDLIGYKYENLINTLSYMKNIWVMTKNYLDQAEKLFDGLSDKITEKSVKNLTLITSMSLGASLITLFRKQEFTSLGFLFVIGLLLAGLLINRAIVTISKNKDYEILDSGYDKDIK